MKKKDLRIKVRNPVAQHSLKFNRAVRLEGKKVDQRRGRVKYKGEKYEDQT